MTNIRVTYRRRNSYNSPSNRIKKVRTPGGRLVAHYIRKKPGVAKCGDCGEALRGVLAFRGKEARRAPRHKRTVTRAYGGSRCGQCVRQRIVRAFLIEERKLVKIVQRQRQAAMKERAKAQKKGGKKTKKGGKKARK